MCVCMYVYMYIMTGGMGSRSSGWVPISGFDDGRGFEGRGRHLGTREGGHRRPQPTSAFMSGVLLFCSVRMFLQCMHACMCFFIFGAYFAVHAYMHACGRLLSCVFQVVFTALLYEHVCYTCTYTQYMFRTIRGEQRERERERERDIGVCDCSCPPYTYTHTYTRRPERRGEGNGIWDLPHTSK